MNMNMANNKGLIPNVYVLSFKQENRVKRVNSDRRKHIRNVTMGNINYNDDYDYETAKFMYEKRSGLY